MQFARLARDQMKVVRRRSDPSKRGGWGGRLTLLDEHKRTKTS
jgi:hypothetical protein